MCHISTEITIFWILFQRWKQDFKLFMTLIDEKKLWKVLGHYQSAFKLGMRSCALHPKWNCYIITVEKGQNLKVLYRVYFWNFIWRIGNPWSLCHLCLWSHCLATIFVKKVISIVHDTFTVIWWSKCQAFFSLIIVIKNSIFYVNWPTSHFLYWLQPLSWILL